MSKEIPNGDGFYLKLESKHGPLLGYNFHQEFDFYSSLCRKGYSTNIQIGRLLASKKDSYICLVSIDRNRKLNKNYPIMVKFAYKLTSYHLFLDESIRMRHIVESYWSL